MVGRGGIGGAGGAIASSFQCIIIHLAQREPACTQSTMSTMARQCVHWSCVFSSAHTRKNDSNRCYSISGHSWLLKVHGSIGDVDVDATWVFADLWLSLAHVVNDTKAATATCSFLTTNTEHRSMARKQQQRAPTTCSLMCSACSHLRTWDPHNMCEGGHCPRCQQHICVSPSHAIVTSDPRQLRHHKVSETTNAGTGYLHWVAERGGESRLVCCSHSGRQAHGQQTRMILVCGQVSGRHRSWAGVVQQTTVQQRGEASAQAEA